MPQPNTDMPSAVVGDVEQLKVAQATSDIAKTMGINIPAASLKRTQEMMPEVWDGIQKLMAQARARGPYQSQLGPLAPMPTAPNTYASDFYDYNSLARMADFSGSGPAGTSVQDRAGINLNEQVGNLRDQRETEYSRRLAATQAERAGQISAEESRRKAYEATTDQTGKQMDLYSKVVDTLKKAHPTADTAKNLVELFKTVFTQRHGTDIAEAGHKQQSSVEGAKLRQKEAESRRGIIASWRNNRASAQEALHQYMVGDDTERAKAQLTADVATAISNGTLTQKEGQDLRSQAESIWKERNRGREVKEKVKTDADVAQTKHKIGKKRTKKQSETMPQKRKRCRCHELHR